MPDSPGKHCRERAGARQTEDVRLGNRSAPVTGQSADADNQQAQRRNDANFHCVSPVVDVRLRDTVQDR